MKLLSLTFIALLLLSGCGVGPLVQMTSVEVSPSSNVRVAKGVTQNFDAFAFYSDGSSRNVTNEVTWTVRQSNSSAAAIRGITGNQIVGGETGESQVVATLQDQTAQVRVTVIPATIARIEVTPSVRTIAQYTTQQFAATAVYTDETTLDVTGTAAWDTSNAAVATVDAASGLVTAVSAGTAGVRATFNGTSGITMMTVTNANLNSITVTPANSSTPMGLAVQFTATGNFSNSTTQDLSTSAVWASSDITVATVSNTAGTKGIVTPVAPGTATISATQLGISGSTNFTVTVATLSSIAVTRASATKAKGLTDQFTATGTYTDSSTADITATVTWTTSNNLVATVSNAGGSQGLATAVDTGSATITATLTGKTGNNTITVSAADLVSIALTSTYTKVVVGGTEQLTATGTYTDASTQDITTSVTYTSADTSKSTVSNAGGSKGLMTGVANGTSAMTATLSGITSPGYTVTTVTLSSIAVTPANPSVSVGNTQQMVATATFSDASTRVVTTNASLVWSTNDACRLDIDYLGTKGLAHANHSGSPTVTATIGGISGTTTVTIP